MRSIGRVDASTHRYWSSITAFIAKKAFGYRLQVPHRRKYYRTTTWKHSGIRRDGDDLLLALARGRERVRIRLPEALRALPDTAFRTVELVYNRARRRYAWHVAIDDGATAEPTTAQGFAAIDLGEIHPATMTDGQEAVIVSCRKLRSDRQHGFKQLAKFQTAQAALKKKSRRWRRLQKRKSRFLAKQALRHRDSEHKISHAVVQWAVDHLIGTLVIGDVRTNGRIYRCANEQCGAVVHRDVVGATNILSRFVHGEVGKMSPPQKVQVSYPVRVIPKQVMRSSGGHPGNSSA